MANNNVNQVTGATQAELNAHSEQALIELVYVRAANDLLGQAMGNLDDALATTQSTINILTGLQNLKNQINVQSKSAFGFDYATGTVHRQVAGNNQEIIFVDSNNVIHVTHMPMNTTTTDPTTGSTRLTMAFYSADAAGRITQYEPTYQIAASEYFGKPIDPFFAFSSSTAPGYATPLNGAASFLSSLKAYKSSLRLEISALTAQTPSASRDDPNGLLATLKKVYGELPSNFNFSTVENWVMDNYNTHGSTAAGSAGALENDLTTALTAAQSLNDTQKEKVRQFLFIFQEYYQSASAVLTSMTQIVEHMAQKISS